MGNVDSREDDSRIHSTDSCPSAAQNPIRHNPAQRTHMPSRRAPQRNEDHKPPRRKNPVSMSVPVPKIEIDPFSVLEIEPTTDEATIKRAYKRLTLKHHPDKGGSDETFDLITKCYVALTTHLDKLSCKGADFQTLKHSASEVEQSTNGKQNPRLNHERFDKRLFNEIFDENRLAEPEDEGYGDIMQDSDRLADEKNIKIENRFKGGYNQNKFMTSFEEEKAADEHRDLVVYDEPQAMLSCNLPFQELGKDRVDDFGQTDKIYQSFCDYKKALSSGSKLIDPAMVDRQGFRNVDHLKTERNNISYDLSNSDKKRIESQLARAGLEEESRLNRLRTKDDEVGKVYNRLNDYMIRDR